MAIDTRPYDSFFRFAFTRIDLAWELTRLIAPELASGREGWRVSVDPDTFVDPALRSEQTDLLIQLERRGSESLVYVLYEHKSSPDRWVALQLLGYLTSIWRRSRSNRPAPTLPRILPVVLYHGRPRWTEPLEFSRLVDGPHADHVPRFAPELVNLADIAVEQISGSLGFVVALLALKFVRQRLTDARVRLLVSWWDRAHADPAARELAEAAERMYARSRTRDEIDRMATFAGDREYHSVEEGLMTYAQEMLQTGQMREKRNVLVRQLNRRFGLTDDEREGILSCDDPDALDAALDDVIVAENKESVLARLP